jgi:hypothetical protein
MIGHHEVLHPGLLVKTNVLEKVAKAKHTSLFVQSISDKEKCLKALTFSASVSN